MIITKNKNIKERERERKKAMKIYQKSKNI
jgi:hypothetical protein